MIYDMIYLLTAIGLSPAGSSTVHIYTQTIHRTIQNKQYTEQHNNWKSAGRAPSWLVITWHLPYSRGKSTEFYNSLRQLEQFLSIREIQYISVSVLCAGSIGLSGL
jgi:hypothetical protein